MENRSSISSFREVAAANEGVGALRPLPHLKSRARRTLFWCTAVLILSPIPGGWLIDHCPFSIRDPQMAANVTLWKKATPRPNILVLGSSRLGSFVRNRELASLTKKLLGNDSTHIFNAAVYGGEPITLESQTRRLLESAEPPPRLVMLEASPDLDARDNRYLALVITRQLIATDLPKYFGEIFLSHDSISRLFSSRLTPFFRHRRELLAWASEAAGFGSEYVLNLNAIVPGLTEGNSFQYARDDGERDPTPVADRMRIEARHFRSHLRHYELTGATPAAFETTIAMLRDRGCAIVLVQPPLSTAQRALLTDEIRKSFAAFVERLETVYGCAFVDYSARLPDEFFVDNHHANNAGSFRFTELLATEVVAPAWRKLESPREEQVVFGNERSKNLGLH
jgi:hypothetical protein